MAEIQPLDTVRALHQTVVSLRAALETSRTELEDLRSKYEQLSTKNDQEENHVKKVVTFDLENENNNNNNIEEVTTTAVNEESSQEEEQTTVVTVAAVSNETPIKQDQEVLPSVKKQSKKPKHKKEKQEQGHYETRVELESRFDLSIRISAVGEDGNVKPVNFKNADIVNSKIENSEKAMDQDKNANIEVKITSEEKLSVNRTSERESASDPNTLEADELSVRSISEGDNSVFSENINAKRIPDHDYGNDSEEVDDIELIFTTEETKELTGFQEDLVSITESEHWGENPDPSTPVLLKFNVLDPDSQHGESTPKTRRGLLKSSGSKNFLETGDRQQSRKSFESNDSFSFDNQKSFSFDKTQSSSFDRESSIDAVSRDLSFDQRDESVDQFDVLRTTMRTQYSVCVETDISKCGVMDSEEFQGNLNIRRNTCPNPFQYRPLPHREVVKGSAVRPVIMNSALRGPRRSSAAQTDISALPDRWRSDTHLARKSLPLALTTLPSKLTSKVEVGTRLAPPKPLRPSRRTEEARRVLLSDIGFTSMVPELSRSAEPVWGPLDISGVSSVVAPALPPVCCAQHASPGFGSVPSSPTRQDSSYTNSRYFSRSSIQRSTSGRMADSSGNHRVSFIDRPMRCDWRGSLPELHGVHCCGSSASRYSRVGKSSSLVKSGTINDGEDSTDELLEEADRFLRSSIDCITHGRTPEDEFCPSRFNKPYLPSGPQQLRLGHLVKVIAPHGRIAIGKVRYVGIAGGPTSAPVTYVGVQTGSPGVSGGGDGSFKGRKYFHCEPGRSIFVPFSKVVMAWSN